MTEVDPHIAKVLSENPTFEVGDVVKLHSGGPSMSVRSISEDEVFCEWFDKFASRSHAFLKKQLRHTTPDQVPIITFNRFAPKGTPNDTPPRSLDDGQGTEL